MFDKYTVTKQIEIRELQVKELPVFFHQLITLPTLI